MYARPGFQHPTGVTKKILEQILQELPLVHETASQEIQGGKPGQHFHLTSQQWAFIETLVALGIDFPDVRIYEPVAANNEIIFADNGDVVMSWGGLVQELGGIHAAEPEPPPPGEVDARFVWSNYIAAKEPGEGASTLDITVAISNTATGVVSPVPSGRTFTLNITCPAKFVGTKSITFTTSASVPNYMVIAGLSDSFTTLGMGSYGFAFYTLTDNTFRITGPANTYVGRGLSNDGTWRLVQSITSEGSPGFSGNNKLVKIQVPGAPILEYESMNVEIGSYSWSWTVLVGQTMVQALTSLAAVIDDDPDWISYYDPFYGCIVQPISGTYGTHPWVNYTPVLTVSPAP